MKNVSIARLTRTVLGASNVPVVRTGSRRAAGSAGRRRQWRSVWRDVRKDAGSVLLCCKKEQRQNDEMNKRFPVG